MNKAVGDPVFAGTINETGELQFRVTASSSNTTLARIIHAVEQAQGTRAPTQRFVDRFAAVYTPAVFALAVAVAVLTPWLIGLSWLDAVYKALVLLVVACPCAMVISTPVTLVSALAAAARRGKHRQRGQAGHESGWPIGPSCLFGHRTRSGGQSSGGCRFPGTA